MEPQAASSPVTERAQGAVGFLAGFTVIVAAIEFLFLRTGTRTLIHIPGLDQFETPIGLLAEIGRLAYYLAIVLVIVSLGYLLARKARSSRRADVVSSALVAAFLVMAVLARLEVVSSIVSGWSSMVVLVGLTVALWTDVRWIPVGLFIGASIAAGWSVLGQGQGGGLSGSSVDGLIVFAEVMLLLAALTSPLLMRRRLTRSSVIVGAVVALVTAGAFAAGGSTVSILVLWNVGVPGWLPGIAYALGLGALSAAVWLGLSGGARLSAIGLVLLLVGGVGVISTYQTGLVVAALLILSEADRTTDWEPETALSSSAVDLGHTEEAGLPVG